MAAPSRNALWITVACGVVAGGCESRRSSVAAARDLITAQVLGQAYLDENRLEEAEAQFATLVRLAPNQAAGYVNLGLVYLRMGRYDRAEAEIQRALRVSPDDPDIGLILAAVYQLAGRERQAREFLERGLERVPRHAKSLYALANLYARSGDPRSSVRAEELLEALVGAAPANVAARLDLVELLVRHERADRATMHLEELQRQIPELPSDGERFLEQALQVLRRSQTDAVATPLRRFRDFLSVTPLYQASIRELWGPQGEPAGVPTLTFSPISVEVREPAAVLAGIHFTDVTSETRLDALTAGVSIGALAAADYDGDGDVDLYIGWQDGGALLTYHSGTFALQPIDGLADLGPSHAAAFADYDNDGWLDLLVAGTQRIALLKNTGGGRFRDVTRTAGLADAPGAHAALFVDADHDGDLDLYLATTTGNRFYRNHLDGTFTDQSEPSGLSGAGGVSRDAAMGDFDEDGDIDVFVVNQDASNALYANQRGGRFQDVAGASGLAPEGGSRAVAVGDYNNDGFLDLFVAAAAGGRHALYRNRGDGTFESDRRSSAMLRALEGVAASDAEFLDFDNDGFLDLLVVGEAAAPSGRGVLLFHNDGTGRFRDMSSVLPGDLLSGKKVVAADYGDGDLDLFLLTADGRIRLLRNDGADANHYVQLRLVGLRTGSGKNNHFGIGAKVELRAGDLYQMRVVTDPVTHFGLGQRLKADVVRIRWTNGVFQDLFYPGSDQDLLEEQLLKGSCAFLYAWDGERYRFVTDIMWRSALGMPLGVMTAGGAYAPPGASQEYVRIPPGLLRAKNGTYSLQITEELWEVAYLDEVKLLVIDHPDSFDIFVDERFVPPAPAPLRIYQARRARPPVSATDDQGNDLLPMIRAQDDVYVANLTPDRYQGVTRMHDLILDLGDGADADSVLLFLNGWVFPTDASVNVAISQSGQPSVTPPVLQVRDPQGGWRTVLADLSFPAGKNKTVVADLTGKFPTRDYGVRIRTNMEVYWDHIFVAEGGSAGPVRITTLQPTAADLHYRGFSRGYRKGGRYGPHWFGYHDVSREAPWGSITGAFTRYGNVSPLVRQSDDMYVIMSPGDEVSVQFDAHRLPELPSRWRRDFILYTDGWIKDADLNTATGDRVTPLPFHDMSRYPYGLEESYPADQAHRRYLTDFNTRNVGPRGR
ncbi:MAG: VCBS repeat-containing protein [Gemmatimonadetes bacterium]|nr:VCBS repeat-containing protein [Gemmatimonadota bacterium]